MKQSGNAKITFNDDDYFKIMKRLSEQQAALPGSANVLGLGGPLYEDTRIVEGQGDERDNMADGEASNKSTNQTFENLQFIQFW